MKTLSSKNQKALKAVHLAAMSIWFSSLFSMFAIGISIPNISSSDTFYYAHKIFSVIDFQILTPAATLTFLTGIVYIIFTKWKLKKHKWLQVKLFITVALIVVGTFYLGPTLKEMTHSAQIQGVTLLKNADYITKLNIATWFSLINGIILFIPIAISTFKPKLGGKKK